LVIYIGGDRLHVENKMAKRKTTDEALSKTEKQYSCSPIRGMCLPEWSILFVGV